MDRPICLVHTADFQSALFSLAGVTVEGPAEPAQALDWMSKGMEFADAIHLARLGHCSACVSFDRKLAKRAQGIAPFPVEIA